MEAAPATITPVLTVRHAAEAVAFYQRAFGAEELHRNIYPDGRIVAGLAVDGARCHRPLRRGRRPRRSRRRRPLLERHRVA